MINSKKLNMISIILTAVVLLSVFGAMLFLDYFKTDDGHITGTLQYSDVHTVYLDAHDYYSDYKKAAHTEIILKGTEAAYGSRNVEKDGKFLKIIAGGTYVLKGTWNGGIVVDSQDGTAVHMVLDGVDINAVETYAIYVKQAESVTISTAEGTVNNISDDSSYNIKYDEEDVTAAIYSKDDLTINGKGTLNISANYQDAVKSNDGLLITEGNINIISADDGINANNYTAVLGGNITINSLADAIKANDTEPEKGFVAIEGGTITINANDDAIHAESNLYLNGGDINIENSKEGLEGAYIEINGGSYNVVSKDDGINASGTATDTSMGRGMMANEKSHTEVVLLINDGNIKLSAGGDGLDSNGAAVINGGYIRVFGPENSGNSSLDFYSTLTINGGTVVAAGSAGMAESPDEGSTQNILIAYLSQNYDAGTSLVVNADDGTEIINTVPDKRYQWVCISSPEIETGKTYTISAGSNTEAELTVESVISTHQTEETGRMGFGRGGMGGFPNMENFDPAQIPEMPQAMQGRGRMRMPMEDTAVETTADTVTEQPIAVNYTPIIGSVCILLAAMILLCFIKRRY